MSPKKWITGALIVLGGVLCVGLLLPGPQKVRNGEPWKYSAFSLKQVAVAMLAHHGEHGALPPAAVRDKQGKPLYSWRVLLLPYLEGDILYSEFHLDEAWDSPHNKAFLEQTPKPYLPHLMGAEKAGYTRLQVLIGPGTAFERDGLTWDDFSDNRAETILVVEGDELVPWSEPVDIPYDPQGKLPVFGGRYTKPYHFLGNEAGRRSGFNAVFADGRVRFVRGDSDEKTMRALITRNGGEKVGSVFVD